MFVKNRKKPYEVFTPRQSEVNTGMYVPRPELEKELEREIYGTKHIIIHGESGSGKSWLYKKVLNDMNINFDIINLANAARHESITEEIRILLSSYISTYKISYTEKKAAELSAGFAKGRIDHVGSYKIEHKEPVEAFLEYLYNSANGKTSCLVFDNLETIFHSNKIMEELGNLIVLLDDYRYSKYKVKFIVVGVPSGVIEYFSKIKNIATIANRLSELPEVSRLDDLQTQILIKNGLIEELKIKFNDQNLYNKYVTHITWVTNGIPQRLHEYCLELSYFCEENSWEASEELLDKADKKWILKSLSKNYAVIDNIMNSKETTVGRRNQVLYALGLIQYSTFTTIDVENLVRKEFIKSTEGVNLNIGQALKSISDYDSAPIKKTPKGNAWLFTDPLFIMCLRAMLIKTSEEKVEKIEISNILS
jgi:nucleoside-triphosphatase THEP1